MLNSIGLANPGLEPFLDEVLPRLSAIGVPIWVSVGGFSADDYAEICAALPGDAVAAVADSTFPALHVDQAAETAAEIVVACRAATDLPLYAKLSPAVPDFGEAAVAIEEAGADGLSLVNTIRGLALDSSLAPILSRGAGGYSGPALKPIALAAVYAARQVSSLPIIGMGGVWNGRTRSSSSLSEQAPWHSARCLSDPDAPTRIRCAARPSCTPWARGHRRGARSSHDRPGQRQGSTSSRDSGLGNPCKNAELHPLDCRWPPARIVALRWSRPRRTLRRRRAPSISEWKRSSGQTTLSETRTAEEGPEAGTSPDRRSAGPPSRVCSDGEGIRHAHGGTEVRSREGSALSEPVSHRSVEDRRRSLRSAAGRADRPFRSLVGRPDKSGWPRLSRCGEHPVFVVTGPSGAGKGTLIRALLERLLN